MAQFTSKRAVIGKAFSKTLIHSGAGFITLSLSLVPPMNLTGGRGTRNV